MTTKEAVPRQFHGFQKWFTYFHRCSIKVFKPEHRGQYGGMPSTSTYIIS